MGEWWCEILCESMPFKGRRMWCGYDMYAWVRSGFLMSTRNNLVGRKCILCYVGWCEILGGNEINKVWHGGMWDVTGREILTWWYTLTNKRFETDSLFVFCDTLIIQGSQFGAFKVLHRIYEEIDYVINDSLLHLLAWMPMSLERACKNNVMKIIVQWHCTW